MPSKILPPLTITQATKEAKVSRERIEALIADGTLEAAGGFTRPIISRESFHRYFGHPDTQRIVTSRKELEGLVEHAVAQAFTKFFGQALAAQAPRRAP